MWEVNPQATKEFIEAFWSMHVLDWSNLDITRIGSFGKSREKPWEHEYKGDPAFRGEGFCPMTTGSDLFYAAAWLTKLSGEKEPLVWGKRLARLFIEARNPKTGISPTFFSWYVKPHPEFAVFPTYYWPALESWPSGLGYFMASPGTVVSPITSDWLCVCMLGEMLGTEGHQFTQWAYEELMAMAKASYHQKDNTFVPISGDGTSMEGYTCKEELLIAKGADVNAKDNWDWTPLHSAIYSSKDMAELKAMVELLIARGANVNAKDGDDRTPLWYAQNEGHTEIVELLRKHGAKE